MSSTSEGGDNLAMKIEPQDDPNESQDDRVDLKQERFDDLTLNRSIFDFDESNSSQWQNEEKKPIVTLQAPGQKLMAIVEKLANKNLAANPGNSSSSESPTLSGKNMNFVMDFVNTRLLDIVSLISQSNMPLVFSIYWTHPNC